MKGKLIKSYKHYSLWDDNKNCIANTINPYGFNYQLSLKNCEAIKRGYDLDKLADEFAKTKSSHSTFQNTHKRDFRAGFQKALELMGDKKFSEDDLRLAIHFGMFGESNNQTTTIGFIQSLQQTEWDVEITTEPHHNGELINDGTTHPIEVTFKPVLDENGCLILKKINYE
jgi:hypothetical protein